MALVEIHVKYDIIWVRTQEKWGIEKLNFMYVYT